MMHSQQRGREADPYSGDVPYDVIALHARRAPYTTSYGLVITGSVYERLYRYPQPAGDGTQTMSNHGVEGKPTAILRGDVVLPSLGDDAWLMHGLALWLHQAVQEATCESRDYAPPDGALF